MPDGKPECYVERFFYDKITNRCISLRFFTVQFPIAPAFKSSKEYSVLDIRLNNFELVRVFSELNPIETQNERNHSSSLRPLSVNDRNTTNCM